MSVCCLAVVTYYFRRYIYEQPAHLRFLVIVLYALRGTRRPHLEANGLAAPGASLRVPQSERSESDHWPIGLDDPSVVYASRKITSANDNMNCKHNCSLSRPLYWFALSCRRRFRSRG